MEFRLNVSDGLYITSRLLFLNRGGVRYAFCRLQLCERFLFL